MKEASVTHATFVIKRNYPAAPEKVYAALSDPEKKRRWFAEGEGAVTGSFQMDFRVGGVERNVRQAKNGLTFTNDTVYRDILPGRRIVLAYNMSMGDRCFSSSLATFELIANGKGTDLIYTDQSAFFEGADGPKMREEGWAKLLDWLGNYLTS
jgi:uncharacterized protein YndB with AHSA1/START domain